ncbi:MAG: membrane protein insertase YidC [Prevotella sp.]|nr:membrane protein insertase YidC [Prevotella sp.]
MNKNSIIGFALIAALLIGYSYFNKPSKEEQTVQMKQDSIAQVEKQKSEEALKSQKQTPQLSQNASDTTLMFHKAYSGQSKKIVLKNRKLALTLDTHGGNIVDAKILNFKDRNGKKDITIFSGKDQQMKFMLSGKNENVVTSDLFFTVTNKTDSTVTLTAKASNGGSINFNYKLNKDYLIEFSVLAQGLSGMFAPNYNSMDIEWTDHCRQQEKGFTFENRYASLTYKKKNGGTDYLNEGKDVVDEKVEDVLDWVAFKNQFFSAVLISKNDFQANSLMTSLPQKKGSGYLKQYGAKIKTFFDPNGKTPTVMELYLGPNDFRLLQKIEKESKIGKDLELQRLVYLGWPLFRIINRWFTLYVFDWLTGLNINMGIVLILITLLLKLITYPLVKKSYMSSAKMRVLKPTLDEATKQYNKPEDQMQKQQAMMGLYSKYGVSPLSGCLPMLIQMPIWIAMFNFVPNAIQLRGESFLWIKDLSTFDPIITWNHSIWLIGDHLSLTCILFCVANVLYSVMSMRQQKDQMVGQQADQMKMMQWMMYLMPVMFFFMFNDYSSGLNFYYFISLFFSAAIMWILRKTTNDEKLLSILQERYKDNKGNPKKATGMAARLEALQKQQEEIKRRREDSSKNKGI